MKEYKLAKGWAIFIYLFAPLLIVLFAWLLILPFKNADFTPVASWILIPVSLGMITLMIFGVINAYKGRVIIQDDRISSTGTSSKRELKLEEIKGYTVNEQYIIVEPGVRHKKRIKISKYIGGYDEILLWLAERFPDLDEQKAIAEEQDILEDETIGLSREIRKEKLSKARKTSKIINWAAGITTCWIFFYPTPYKYSILTAIILPIIALLVVRFSNRLIRIDEKKGTAYPSVVFAFIFPPLGLMLRAISDFNISDYSNVWLTTIIITISFLFLLLLKQKDITFEKKVDYLTVSCLALFIFAYSFGTVTHINCYYDNSKPQNFTAQVLGKRTSSGKSTTYYLELSFWEQQKEVDEVSVGKELYDRIEPGDEVKIYFRNGKLKIPWFIVTENEKERATTR